jgi:hypothetical protein
MHSYGIVYSIMMCSLWLEAYDTLTRNSYQSHELLLGQYDTNLMVDWRQANDKQCNCYIRS